MGTTVIFREFRDTDKESVAKFFHDIYTGMGWTIRPEYGFDDPKKYFYSRQGLLLLAEVNKQIIGTSGIIPLNNEDAVLKRFYIDSQYRGKGLAKEFLDYTIEYVKKRHFVRLVLDVTKKNQRAIRFYEKNNFVLYHPKPHPQWSESHIPEVFIYYKREI